MAYYDKERFGKKTGQERDANGISKIYFEERKCAFGSNKFSVMLPRKAFADLIMNYPAAGAA